MKRTAPAKNIFLSELIDTAEYRELETGQAGTDNADALLTERDGREGYVMHKGLFGIDREAIKVMRHPTAMEVCPHSHDFYEIQYVAGGEVRQTINGQDVRLPAGSLTVFNKNIVHSIHKADSQARMFFIFVDENVVAPRFLSLLSKEDVLVQYIYRSSSGYCPGNEYVLYRQVDESLERLIWDLYAEGRYKPLDYNRLSFLYLAELFAKLGRHSRVAETGLGARNVAANLRKLDKVEEYIRRNPQAASLGEAASLLHMHRNSLCRVIRDITGKTFTALVQDIRLELAEYLLATTDCPIEAITRDIGYDNAAYFYSLFKRKHGLTPGGYRARYLKST